MWFLELLLSGNFYVTSYRILAEKRAAPMGRIPRNYERPADCTGKVARGQTGQGKGNLAAVDGKVPALVDGS